LVAVNAILIRYQWQLANLRALYESIDGPAGRPAENLPNSDGLGVYHGTVPEWAVRVYWRPGPPIWQRFGLDPDPDPKWRSGTVANTKQSGCLGGNAHFNGSVQVPTLTRNRSCRLEPLLTLPFGDVAGYSKPAFYTEGISHWKQPNAGHRIHFRYRRNHQIILVKFSTWWCSYIYIVRKITFSNMFVCKEPPGRTKSCIECPTNQKNQLSSSRC